MPYAYNELGLIYLGGAVSENINETMSKAALGLYTIFYAVLYALFLIPAFIGKIAIFLMQRFTLKKERTDATLVGYLLVTTLFFYSALAVGIASVFSIPLTVSPIILISIMVFYRVLPTLVWPHLKSAKIHVNQFYEEEINRTLKKNLPMEEKMVVVSSYRLIQKLFEKLRIPLNASISLTRAINYSMLVEIRIKEVEKNKELTKFLDRENEKFSIVLGRYLAEIGG